MFKVSFKMSDRAIESVKGTWLENADEVFDCVYEARRYVNAVLFEMNDFNGEVFGKIQGSGVNEVYVFTINTVKVD